MASLAGNFGNSRQNPHGRTKADRRKITPEGRCIKRDIIYQRERFDNDESPVGHTSNIEMRVNDCFLKGVHFIDDNKKDVIIAQSLLNKRKKPMNIDYSNLPIYVINANSSDEFYIELTAPLDMNKKKANEEREYSYDSQLKENFTIF